MKSAPTKSFRSRTPQRTGSETKFNFSKWFNQALQVDRQFLTLTLLISGFGLLMVYNASVVTAHRHFGDQYYFLKHQGMWLVIGICALLTTSQLSLDWWQRNSRTFLMITLGLLVVVLLGSRTLGAKSWLSISGFSLQPSELAKITLTAYLASVFIKFKEPYLEFLKATGIVLALVMLQPDLGTSLVIASSAFAVYWAAGAPLKHFVAIAVAGLIGVLGMIVVSPYRLNRLLTFINSDQDPLGTSYHVRQILLSIGSGGWWGVGIGQSRQKYAYLPEVTSDSIFAIIAEESGFVGSSILILILLAFLLKGLKIASSATDPYARLFGIGLITWIAVQTFINLAAMVILVPLTGIPLPLISYGGSSLVVTLTSLGVLLSISRQPAMHQSRK